jgi:nicotinate-nucleotide pyrophosphorylase (carboxylating)
VSVRTPPRAVALEPLPPLLYEPLVRAALLEDLGLAGDLTSEATIPRGTAARAALVAREPGVLAGLEAALLAFELLDPSCEVARLKRDGQRVVAGEACATLAGDARALLGAERTALNLLGRLSGIATATAAAVEAAGGACAIVETRKTTPGLRALEKYAVRAGGGQNHRLRLDDAILIKDNHVALAGGVTAALERARSRAGHLVKIQIEVDTLAQLDEVLACEARPDAVLLDNFELDALREAVRRTAGRLLLEASGRMSLERIAAAAASGVDVISIGALTHSVQVLDLGLDVAGSELE